MPVGVGEPGSPGVLLALQRCWGRNHAGELMLHPEHLPGTPVALGADMFLGVTRDLS